MEHCEVDEPFNGALLEFAIVLPIIITLQLVIFCNTLRREYTRSNPISIKLRILYILLQIFGLWWTIIDFLRFVIDPFTKILQKTNSICVFAAYTPKIAPILYYYTYLYQIYLRTESSFTGSVFALNKTTKYALLSLLVVCPPIFASVSYFIINRNTSPCTWSWKPSDFPLLYDTHSFSFCAFPIQSAAHMIINIATAWVGIGNIIFGAIFAYKLRKLLSSDYGQGSETEFQFKSLIIKCCILTLSGSISTIMSYALWLHLTSIKSGFGAMFLYADVLINCAVIGLMFRHNAKYYLKLCKCCIMMCMIKCDKKRRTSMEDVIEYVDGNDVRTIELKKSKSPETCTEMQLNISGITVTSLIAQYGSNTHHVVELDDIIDDEVMTDDDIESPLSFSIK